jgi:hypothetical protein
MAAGDYYELWDRQTRNLVTTFTNFKKALRFIRSETSPQWRANLSLSKHNRAGEPLTAYCPEELNKLIAEKLAWAEVMDQASANIIGHFGHRHEALRFIVEYLPDQAWANLSVFECNGFGEIVGCDEGSELVAILNKLSNQILKTSK